MHQQGVGLPLWERGEHRELAVPAAARLRCPPLGLADSAERESASLRSAAAGGTVAPLDWRRPLLHGRSNSIHHIDDNSVTPDDAPADVMRLAAVDDDTNDKQCGKLVGQVQQKYSGSRQYGMFQRCFASRYQSTTHKRGDDGCGCISKLLAFLSGRGWERGKHRELAVPAAARLRCPPLGLADSAERESASVRSAAAGGTVAPPDGRRPLLRGRSNSIHHIDDNSVAPDDAPADVMRLAAVDDDTNDKQCGKLVGQVQQ